MHQFSQDLTKKLNALNQRMIKKGEIFLLAKAIADALPLMPVEMDNVKLFILNHKIFIDKVIYDLNNYTYLDETNIALVEKLICDITLWRFAIAHNPPNVFYRGDPNYVIDDISSLPCFIDVTYMCAVSELSDNVNYMSGLFNDLVKTIKLNLQTNNHVKDTVPSTIG